MVFFASKDLHHMSHIVISVVFRLTFFTYILDPTRQALPLVLFTDNSINIAVVLNLYSSNSIFCLILIWITVSLLIKNQVRAPELVSAVENHWYIVLIVSFSILHISFLIGFYWIDWNSFWNWQIKTRIYVKFMSICCIKFMFSQSVSGI